MQTILLKITTARWVLWLRFPRKCRVPRVVATLLATWLLTYSHTPCFAELAATNDEALVRSLGRLDLSQVLPDQTWVVANVFPKGSYSHIPGGYIDAKGQIHTPLNAHMVNVLKGSYKVLDVLAGTPAKESDYELEDTVRRNEGMEKLSVYQVFVYSPGTAVFRINETAQGIERFTPAYHISQDWAPLVAPALQQIRANPDWFRSDATDQHRLQLKVLLTNPNPFLAIAAGRSLSEAHQLDPLSILQIRGLVQGVLTTLVLQQLPSDELLPPREKAPTSQEEILADVRGAIGKEPMLNQMGQLTDSAPDSETLRQIAFGVVALFNGSPRVNIFTVERANFLLRRIDKRQAALGTHTDADSDLQNLLVLYGVRRQRPVTPARRDGLGVGK